MTINETNLSDYVGKPIFSSEKMYPTTPVNSLSYSVCPYK